MKKRPLALADQPGQETQVAAGADIDLPGMTEEECIKASLFHRSFDTFHALCETIGELADRFDCRTADVIEAFSSVLDEMSETAFQVGEAKLSDSLAEATEMLNEVADEMRESKAWNKETEKKK